MDFPRRSGILLHPTSLPGPHGIGDLGEEAYAFVDFLAEAGQTYWQTLPLSPTGYGDSPYQGLSAFAGNPMLISPEKLVQAGQLIDADLLDRPVFGDGPIDFGAVIPYKTDLLNRAFERFKTSGREREQRRYARFCEKEAFWLDDFALYMAIKEHYDMQPWKAWDADIARRDPAALRAARERSLREIENQRYRQWQFSEQWMALREYANQHGIRIIGDIPIFVSMDSADVWAHTQMFEFDDQLEPIVVSGVPPDIFSDTGQFWGHPLYRWDRLAEDGYQWWIERFRAVLAQMDIVRIDHFRGFYDYWAVPWGEVTAINGTWIPGPGADLLRAVAEALGEVPIVAEDLGAFTKEARAGVERLLDEFGYPGMKLLQFAFSTDAQDPFLPHNFSRDWVVYTGTHDNDTNLGWYQHSSAEGERDSARKYMGVDGSDISWDLIRLAWSSVAHTAMTTAQDLLDLDEGARMNLPSTIGAPNWGWRLTKNALTPEIARRLLELTAIYGRTPG